MLDRADLAIVRLDAVGRRHALENPPPRFGRGRANLQLVRNAAQERRVHQIGRRQVGGEDHHRLERHPETLAGGQLQIIHPVFQRHDPAVEQRGGGHHLAAEIVDQQHAARRLHVQRRGIEIAAALMLQIEHLQREFTPRHDERAAARHKAAISLIPVQRRHQARARHRGIAIHRQMHIGIKHRHHLAFHQHGMRNVDHMAEHAIKPLRHRCLAVAGRAIHQQRPAHGDRRAQLVHQLIGHFQAVKGTAHAGGIDDLVGHLLALDPMGINFQRHRRRPGIGRTRHRLPRPQLAGIGQFITHAQLAAANAAQRRHHLAPCGRLQQLRHQARRQAQRRAQLGRRLRRADEQELQHQIDQKRLGQARFRHGGGLHRHPIHELREVLRRNRTHRHQVRPQPAARLVLAINRLLDLRLRDQPGRYQQFANLHAHPRQ